MSEVTLIAETGRATGTSPSRRLRAEGKIPAILYGQGVESTSIEVDRRELRLALSGPSGYNTLINLSVDGVSHPTVVKSLQRHPVKHTVSHVDFLKVSLDEEIEVSVPLHLEGEAKAVQAAGGLVDPAVDTITVRTKPGNVPGAFTYDVTDLEVGAVIRVSELTMPGGVELVDDPDTVIVTALAARVEEVAEVAAEEGEGEPGAVEGAPGETAAAEGGDTE